MATLLKQAIFKPNASAIRLCSTLIVPNRDHIFEKYPNNTGVKREAWIESLEQVQDKKLGLMPLHPEVWSVMPRVDIITENIRWQKLYKRVDYIHTKNRYEMPKSNRKPWPQKGTGRARHGTVNSPIWKDGGKAHGPRAPRTYFFMLPYAKRVNGIIHTLSAKFAQDDVRIVENLEIPTDDPSYIEDVIDERNWGLSSLFVDVNDIFPPNLTSATDKIPHCNLMPVYGLNCQSMLHHKTLVLTVDAVNRIEEKLLFALHRSDKFERSKLNNDQWAFKGYARYPDEQPWEYQSWVDRPGKMEYEYRSWPGKDEEE